MLGTYTPTQSPRSIPFDIPTNTRLKHTVLVGGTGTGKTTAMRNLILSDIHNHHGVAFLDPHGDSAQEILDLIPPQHVPRTVYFSVRDAAHPFSWNPLPHTPDPNERHRIAAELVDALKGIWRDSWGARMERILLTSFRVQLDQPNPSFFGVWRFLGNLAYREHCLRQVKDPIIKRFWLSEFPKWTKGDQTNALMPPLNRIDAILASPIARNILSQSRARITIRHIMDRRMIFIADLSSGIVGSDTSHLLGSLLTSQFISAAMARANILPHMRVPFYLHADEYASFKTHSFAKAFSETRKYKLGLTLACQFLDQAPDMVEPIMANGASIFAFRVGDKDANRLAPVLDTESEHLMRAGTGAARFREEIEVPKWVNFDNTSHLFYGLAPDIVAHSRENYARPLDEVEQSRVSFMQNSYRDS